MNRGTATNPSNESSRKPAPPSLAASFLLALSLGLAACPVDAAWGRVSVGSSHPSQRFEEPAPVAPRAHSERHRQKTIRSTMTPLAPR